ncbi:MAG: HPF/RaiA family ribosome-associated protein [Nibricoccus sp.]
MNSKILISGLHLSPETHLEITRLLEKPLRHNSAIVRLRLDLHESGLHGGCEYHTAKAVMEMRGPDLVASESSDNLFTAIHRVIDKLERRLAEHMRRHAGKRRHLHAIDLPAALPKLSLP